MTAEAIFGPTLRRGDDAVPGGPTGSFRREGVAPAIPAHPRSNCLRAVENNDADSRDRRDQGPSLRAGLLIGDSSTIGPRGAAHLVNRAAGLRGSERAGDGRDPIGAAAGAGPRR